MKVPFFKLPKQAEKRNRVVGLMIGFCVAVFFGFVTNDAASKFPLTAPVYELVKGLENNTYDLRFRLRGPMSSDKVSKNIVLLDYDDGTLTWAPYPPDRTIYAEVVKALGKQGAGARAMFYDIFFFDPFGRRLETANVPSFQQKMAELGNAIKADETLTGSVKEQIYAAYEKLNGSGGPAEAKAILDGILADNGLKDDAGYFASFRDYLKENEDLHLIAPDIDKMFHDAIQAADNVYLGQIVDDLMPVPYTVDDILYDPKIHKTYARMIMMSDRTKTRNKLELDVNTSMSNFLIADYKRVLEESSKQKVKGGRKALPFTKAEMEKIRNEMKGLSTKRTAALALNEKTGWEIPKNAPVPIAELKKYYRSLREIQPLNANIVAPSRGLAYVKPELQADGVIRMLAPFSFYEDKLYPHITMLLVMAYYGVQKKDVVFYKDKIEFRNASAPGEKTKKTITLPLYKNRAMIVNWAGTFYEQNQFEHRSLRTTYELAVKYNAMNKKARGETLSPNEELILAAIKPGEEKKIKDEMAFFKDKVVMTGLTAADTHDLNPIPLSPRYPLVGMHANVPNMIIKGLFIRVVPSWLFALLLIAMGMVMGYVGGTAKQLPGALAMAGANIVYAIVCVALFSFARVWLLFIPALGMLVMVYLIVLIYRFMTEGQEAKKMKGMFATYVNPSVVETLIQHPEKLRLGGERMELTAMFALAWGPGLDSESAEEMVDRLNEYFTHMTEQIFKFDGTLDKYEGHIIMAIYGAPVHFDDHAAKACLSCAGMKKSLEALWDKWKSEGKENIYVTVGLNSGPMIAGNMGSASRFSYTIMGDSVNISARILGAAKQYGVDYMISENTFNQAAGAVVCRIVDDIVVVGKVEPVKVYQILCAKGETLKPEVAGCKEAYEKGFELYTQRKWDEAIASFKKALEHIPDDKPSKMLAERCEKYKENPPAEGWKGEFSLTSKGL